MKKLFLSLFACFQLMVLLAQKPITSSAADILSQLKKLEVFGAVLYIAAHPDDENTRLLAYLANEKKYRTGYLSLTRGDGGQNLIGDEQGIDLGLIRTQELLAARRIDGAEQFFSRAYDFGFSKNPEEALRIWGHDKILSDVVWVIRKFRPDVIITRFPTTGEGGHGHHTASAILAGEAFDAAADSTKFPEQLKYVSTWQAKRLLWNTFNFGTTNTTREDQFKIDCGGYNPILGKSYGEIAAEGRSQHKSQGFGVPAQRGVSYEYFSTIKGDKPVNDLMDGVDVTNYRMILTGVQERETGGQKKEAYSKLVKKIIENFNPSAPQQSLKDLQELYNISMFFSGYGYDKSQDINKLIFICSGIFAEAIANQQLNAVGDSMRLQFILNNRLGVAVGPAQVSALGTMYRFADIKPDVNTVINASLKIDDKAIITQPYWIEHSLAGGAFDVREQQMIGMPQSLPPSVSFQITINDIQYTISKPIQYKYTDPVKGEIYQPIQFIHPLFINSSPALIIFSNNKKNEQKNLKYTLQSNIDINEKVSFANNSGNKQTVIFDSSVNYKKGDKRSIDVILKADSFASNSTTYIGGDFSAKSLFEHQYFSLHKISYDHIPDVFYNYYDQAKIIKLDMKTSGTLAGYIAGAGDKVPDALQQMGYTVVMLTEKDIRAQNLKQFDVIITGVRAYNIHDWLNNSYAALMQYIREGGVLLVQYNTNNSIGPVKAKISPYPFSISRNRITDETAKVNFLLPNHAALNYPNKITEKDFDGWIQERSTYHAENIDSNYQRIFSMKDPGEQENDGSLIIANYGKGRFIYSGIVFFRELPAGVPGAYRLFANLIANDRKK